MRRVLGRAITVGDLFVWVESDTGVAEVLEIIPPEFGTAIDLRIAFPSSSAEAGVVNTWITVNGRGTYHVEGS